MRLRTYLNLYCLDENRLTKKLLTFSIKFSNLNYNGKYNTWTNYYLKLFNKFNILYLWNADYIKLYTKNDWKNFTYDLLTQYESTNYQTLISSNIKLENYLNWLPSFKFQDFLSYNGPNCEGVYELVKLRLSSHNLEIEVSRYGKNYMKSVI